MKIDILTLFPTMFEGFLNESIIKRAQDKKLVEINVHNIRDFTLDIHKKVDDYGYGGGKGMVLMPEPVVRAIEEYKTKESIVILMCPQGEKYTEKKALELSNKKHIILVCGHYEGYDERIRNFVDMEISIGDYILTGGELPAMVVTDSITRLIDGVIEKESYENESFNNNLLDYPVYTKPQEFRGIKVPDVLLSGHHENINKWRLNESIKRTKIRRPDLLKKDD
ncbi:MAG: tRNA (guanosine(37)-N1)-methyltransferase TrmD [Bacilli bacterium]|nr:tRNA (guanosine(37)-N1)-methyltransferase TrmD [Bacilli bacterium]